MSYQNQAHFIVQPTAGFGIRQNLRRRRVLDLPGGNPLWLAVLKASSLILLLLSLVTIWIGSAVNDMHVSIQTIKESQHEMKNRQIYLLSERALLMSAQYVQEQAREELALVIPDSRQVHKMR
ncbi:MAG: hypothetical protein CR981_01255 [Proteobacteria bacterium]|nr:MAG: hypothetical protein CR981_01255 [Pseudomonadota bacterium]